jgi:hypothetical protein
MSNGRGGMMTPPRMPYPRHVRYSVRHQARLDAETHAKLEANPLTFHRKRSAILRFVLRWGLTHTQGGAGEQTIHVTVPPVPVLLEPELLQQVQKAAAVHGTSLAAWVRHAMRHDTAEDFPASWRLGETARRSHESGYYHRKFGLRLDAVTSHELETLTHTFDRPAAEVIRQLIMQARPEEFPESWHLAADARRQRETRVGEGDR